MKRALATLIILSFAVQAVANPLKSKALMPAPNQAPIGMLPYTAVPTALSIPTPYYGQAYQGIQPQLATGSYAYTPGMAPAQGPYGNPQMMANPQMCAMNPQMCLQMNPQMYAQMGGMAGTQLAQQPGSPAINPQMLMAALAALPGLAYDWQNKPSPSTSSSRTEVERYRPSQRSRESIREPIPPETTAAGSTRRQQREVQRPPEVVEPRQPVVEQRQPEVVEQRQPVVEARQPVVEQRQPERIASNQIATTIARIETHNTTQPIATSPGTRCVPDPSCVDCVNECQAIRSEQCNAANNYFEEVVGSSASDPAVKIAKAHASASGTMNCVREAIKFADNDRLRFASCPTSSSPLSVVADRPCASDNLVKTMAGSYELVSDCLAGYVDPAADQAHGSSIRSGLKKSMFQLWNYESGFSPNALKKTATSANGGGPGQLVVPVIESINKGAQSSQFEQMKSYIKNSTNKSCKMLARHDFKPIDHRQANSCQRTAMDNGNPMLNLMYSMAYMKTVRAGLFETVTSVDGIPNSTRDRVINDLTIWGQSGGKQVSIALTQVMKTHGTKLVGQPSEQKYMDFMAAMQKELKTSLQAFRKQNPGPPIDIDGITTFLEKTQTDLSNLNGRVNGTCGVF